MKAAMTFQNYPGSEEIRLILAEVLSNTLAEMSFLDMEAAGEVKHPAGKGVVIQSRSPVTLSLYFRFDPLLADALCRNSVGPGTPPLPVNDFLLEFVNTFAGNFFSKIFPAAYTMTLPVLNDEVPEALSFHEYRTEAGCVSIAFKNL